jgi:Cu-Zn family superoxide dismutase
MSWKRVGSVMAASAILTIAATSLFAQRGSPGEEITKAVAVLHPTQGSQVHGTVTFTKEAGGIRVKGEIMGLTPGKHGFHVHEFGDCHSPEAKSAGSHFNPTKAKHAGHDVKQRHVGDLGNIEANAQGVAKVDLLDDLMTFQGAHSVIGRGLIVHEKADDLKTQPTGDAGGRLACGVIGIASP